MNLFNRKKSAPHNSLGHSGRGSLELLDAKTMKIVRANFDPTFYLSAYPDVRQAKMDPFVHFMKYGSVEQRDPNANFSTTYYQTEYGSSIPEGMHPFVHYLLNRKNDSAPSASPPNVERMTDEVKQYFDEKFYVSQYSDVAQSPLSPLQHYLCFGSKEGRDPSATFPARWYRAQYMVGEPLSTNPLVHVLRRGQEIVLSAPLELEKQDIDKISVGFDADFYKRKYLNSNDRGVDPLTHYLKLGWLLGFDPSEQFSTTFYMKAYRSKMPQGVNPLVHYILKGQLKRYVGSHVLSEAERSLAVVEKFDSEFYLTANEDVRSVGLSPFEHFMLVGWRENRDPTPTFSTVFYMRAYPDVIESGLSPLLHYAMHGAGRHTRSVRPYLEIAPEITRYSNSQIFARCQDLIFPLEFETTKKLLVIVTPEHNEMSGGIFSMFSIAKTLRKTKRTHGFDVLLMTRPNPAKDTYIRQRNFRNQEDMFRFEQILYCNCVEELYIHIPEYMASDFIRDCSEPILRYLMSRKVLHINILNQNIELMQDASSLAELRHIADEVTQSVAHHAYFSQEIANKYMLPTMLLPAYTDLREYTPRSAREKEKLIIYSLDEAWYKSKCLELISKAFPDYRIFEIKGVTFDQFMDFATRCKFSISFGEGFDGYVAQPIYQGGIAFTLFREEFFPSREFLRFPNFFRNEDALLGGLTSLMKRLEQDEAEYDALNRKLVDQYDTLYRLDDYEKKVVDLAQRKFELFPE